MCEISESDCCGNGCTNCILDSKPLSTKRADLTQKKNILHTYRKYKLIEINHYNNRPHLIQLKFTIAEENGDNKQLTEFILDCPPGHHLMMRAPVFDGTGIRCNKTVLRPYSPFWTDMTEFQFKILVNLKPNGQMTKYIEKLKLNDEVEFRGPIGVFVYEPSLNADSSLVIFCQGVAIAPTIPILERILHNEDDNCRIYHFSCFQNIDSIIFREKLIEFNRYWNFSSETYLSHQKCSECCDLSFNGGCEHFKRLLKYKEQVKPRRLSMQIISSSLEEIKSTKKQFVVCGSNTFQEFIKDCLIKCDINKNCIFVF
ncbi:NADH-cytochrome b5 reductase-like [Eupeodes corollae]|uniref:NADH-cytochrome b5 reductase-like n=1 Tax=Eupeodes corollae TaxID=290404 RepID=UPI002491B09B|nr:NADH-cytochrome b5 reductase-like [Eupeodes corollae]